MEASGTKLLERLTTSAGFRAFERDFARATGLPVRVLDRDGAVLGGEAGRLQSPVCGLIEATAAGCSLCQEARARLAAGASGSACGCESGQCPGGLHEEVLPIQLGQEVLGFLQTGQVLLEVPSTAGFERLSRWLETRGVPFDRAGLRAAYDGTAVLEPEAYQAMLGLLRFGADGLARRAAEVLQRQEAALSEPMVRACRYIRENLHEPLSMVEAARVAGLSRHHFCKVFHRELGRTFTAHVTVLRVEAAAERLREPGTRVSEIALAVGFQSISQFNRSFKQVLGVAPKEWRARGANAS